MTWGLFAVTFAILAVGQVLVMHKRYDRMPSNERDHQPSVRAALKGPALAYCACLFAVGLCVAGAVVA